MRNIIKLLLFAICVSTFSYAQQAYQYTEPKRGTDGWKTSTLASQKVDSTLIYKFFDQFQHAKHKIHSILFAKNDTLIVEEYYDNHTIDTQHDLRSVTKSIRAILLGIAIEKGFIDSVNDPISKYLKNPVPVKNLDERKNDITIKHLITMSTGLDCNDWDKKSKGQEDRVYKKKDWIQYTLDLPMINDPGAVSNYCSMGVLLLAEIISQASGMPIDTFAKKFLFDTLGIANLSWGHTSDKEVISSGKRLHLTSRDLAKIGLLMLNNGTWNDKQVVPATWIEEATTPKTKITGIDYGYLWWTIPFKIEDKMMMAKVATGNGGQYIMIFPESNIVAIFTGGAYNSQDDKLPFAIMTRVLLPTFVTRKE